MAVQITKNEIRVKFWGAGHIQLKKLSNTLIIEK